MKKHCCKCGAKAPKQVGGTAWLSIRADNDPTHYFCPEHKDGAGMKHCADWRAGRIGCRVALTAPGECDERLWSAKASIATMIAADEPATPPAVSKA